MKFTLQINLNKKHFTGYISLDEKMARFHDDLHRLQVVIERPLLMSISRDFMHIIGLKRSGKSLQYQSWYLRKRKDDE